MAGSFERHWSLSIDENVSAAMNRIAEASGRAEETLPRLATGLSQGLNEAMAVAKATEAELANLVDAQRRIGGEMPATPRYQYNEDLQRYQDTLNKKRIASNAEAAQELSDRAALEYSARTNTIPDSYKQQAEFFAALTESELKAYSAAQPLDTLIASLESRLQALGTVSSIDKLPTSIETIGKSITQVEEETAQLYQELERIGQSTALQRQIAEMRSLREQVPTPQTDYARALSPGMTPGLDPSLNARLQQLHDLEAAVEHYNALLEENPISGSETAYFEAMGQQIGRDTQNVNELNLQLLELRKNMGMQLDSSYTTTWAQQQKQAAQEAKQAAAELAAQQKADAQQAAADARAQAQAQRQAEQEAIAQAKELAAAQQAAQKQATAIGPEAVNKATIDAAKSALSQWNAEQRVAAQAAKFWAESQNQATSAVEKTTEATSKGHSFLNDFAMGMGLNVTSGMLLAQGITAVIGKVKELGSNFIEAGQDQEQYMAGFTRLIGSVSGAQAAIAATRQQSMDLPLPVDDLIAAQRRYQAAVEQGQTVQERYGRSMQGLLAITADVIAARPDINVNQLATAIERVSVGAPNAERYIRQLGLSAKDLTDAGGQLNAAGNRLVGTLESNTAAVIGSLEKKYSGVSQLSSQTWQGMSVEIGNFMTNAGITLGQDIFADVRTRLRDFLDGLKDPKVQATLQDWGDKLGRIWNTGMMAFDALAQGVRQFAELIKPATDLLGQFIGMLPQGADAGANAYNNLSAAAQQYGVAQAQLIGEQAQIADEVQGTQDSIAGLDQAIADLRNRQTGLTQPLQDGIKGLQDETGALKEHYDSLIQPWKDLIEQQNRAFENEKANRQENTLAAQIAKDKKLQVDIYSAGGRAARQRLPGEEDQLANLQAEQAHKHQVQGEQDVITRLQNEQKAKDNAIQDDEKRLQRQIDMINRGSAADIKNLENQKRAMQQHVRDLNRDMTDWQNKLSGVSASYDALTDNMKDRLDLQKKREADAAGAHAITWDSMANALSVASGRMITDINNIGISLLGKNGLRDAELSAKESWDLVIKGFVDAGAPIAKTWSDIVALAHSFGLDKGLATMLLEARTAGILFFEFLGNSAPPVLTAIGTGLRAMVNTFDVLVKYIIATKDAFVDLITGKGISPQTRSEVAATGTAFKTLMSDLGSGLGAVGKSFTADAHRDAQAVIDQQNIYLRDLKTIYGTGSGVGATPGLNDKPVQGPPSPPKGTSPGTTDTGIPVPQGMQQNAQASISGTITIDYVCPTCHQSQFQEDVRVNRGFIGQQIAGTIGRA